MNARIIASTALIALALSSCADNADDGSGDAATATSDATATVDTAASAEETKVYEARGKVTKIDRDNSRVELDHEEIEGWMDAMVMPFPVSDAALLDQVEVGKTYQFSVEVRGDDYRITKFTAAP